MKRRVEPQFDHRLIGVWSRELAGEKSVAGDVRILFKSNFSGRYETWHNGLTEVITFNWSPPAADRVTLAGVDYLFRDDGTVRREPCNWHFEAVPYSIDGGDVPRYVLRLQFGPQRVDRFALVSASLEGFEQPQF